MEQEELKLFSVSVFRSLCSKVKGHVTTWPEEGLNSVFVRIRKGPVNFEVRLQHLKEFVDNEAKFIAPTDDIIAICSEKCAKEVLKQYKEEVLLHYIK